MLDAGADANVGDIAAGTTPAALAIEAGYASTLSLVLRHSTQAVVQDSLLRALKRAAKKAVDRAESATPPVAPTAGFLLGNPLVQSVLRSPHAREDVLHRATVAIQTELQVWCTVRGISGVHHMSCDLSPCAGCPSLLRCSGRSGASRCAAGWLCTGDVFRRAAAALTSAGSGQG